MSDLVDQLDLSAITLVYEDEERGQPPYHPVMVTKVLVYAYCVGVFSSRKIERHLSEDVAFRARLTREPRVEIRGQTRRRSLR